MQYAQLSDYEKSWRNDYLSLVESDPIVLIQGLIRAGLIRLHNYHISPKANDILKPYFRTFVKSIPDYLKIIFINDAPTNETHEIHQSRFIVKLTKVLIEEFEIDKKKEQTFSSIKEKSERVLHVPFLQVLATVAVYLKEEAKEEGLLTQKGDFLYQIKTDSPPVV